MGNFYLAFAILLMKFNVLGKEIHQVNDLYFKPIDLERHKVHCMHITSKRFIWVPQFGPLKVADVWQKMACREVWDVSQWQSVHFLQSLLTYIIPILRHLRILVPKFLKVMIEHVPLSHALQWCPSELGDFHEMRAVIRHPIVCSISYVKFVLQRVVIVCSTGGNSLFYR